MASILVVLWGLCGLHYSESIFSNFVQSACRDYCRMFVHRTDDESKKQGQENQPANKGASTLSNLMMSQRKNGVFFLMHSATKQQFTVSSPQNINFFPQIWFGDRKAQNNEIIEEKGGNWA